MMATSPQEGAHPRPPAWLTYEPVVLRFGTSGLRGRVVEMTDLEIYINTRGFLDYLQADGDLGPGAAVAVAEDLRRIDPTTGLASSPRIARAVGRAVRDAGFELVHYGAVPTPALAYQAGRSDPAIGKVPMPSIMVTGSHIPADRNGVKFYKQAGEVLKSDEAGILRAVRLVREQEYAKSAQASLFDERGMLAAEPHPEPVDPSAAEAYVARYTELFASRRPLAGRRIVVYEHSAVGRELLARVLASLGATTICVDRSDDFVPVDTEDVGPEDEARFLRYASEHHPDAIVSTDGDSDRPLVVDERGRFHRGDVLGIITAEFVGARYAAVPISTSDALDRHVARRVNEGGTASLEIHKTRIGSPYVIAAMTAAARRGVEGVVGWEANGGFLLGTDVQVDGVTLAALPTRDAMLPILAPLVTAARRQVPVSRLFDELPPRMTRAGLIDAFPPERSRAILARLGPRDEALSEIRFSDDDVWVTRQGEPAGEPESASSDLADELRDRRALIERYFSARLGLGPVTRLNLIDGLRVWFENGDIAHLRPSGNAPQFRIYAVSDRRERADEIVAQSIAEPNGLLRAMERELTGG